MFISVSYSHNARLRGWQRIPLDSSTTTATTAAQWDRKRHALTVPLEAFVMPVIEGSNGSFLSLSHNPMIHIVSAQQC
ncbi:hypothetical protein EGX57_18320 [Vibrio cholerae]|nr:hypothetical protein [Vibrio cholerae]EGR1421560.1 hypothetical protein [Vibrio cholerae]